MYPTQILQPVNLAQLTPAQQQQILLQQQQMLQQQAQMAGVNLLPQYMQLLTSTLQKPGNSTSFVNPMMQAPMMVNPAMLQPTPQQAQKMYNPAPPNQPAKQPTTPNRQGPVANNANANRNAGATNAANNQHSVVLNSNVVNAGQGANNGGAKTQQQSFSGSLLSDFDVNSALNSLTLNQQTGSQTSASPLSATFNPNSLPWSLSSLAATTNSNSAAEDMNGDFEEAINAFRNKNMYQDDEGALLPSSLMDSIEDKMSMSGTPNMNWDPAAFDNGSNFAPIPFKGSSSPRTGGTGTTSASPGSILLGTASPNLGSRVSPTSTPTPFNLNPSGQSGQSGLGSMFWNTPSSQGSILGSGGSMFDNNDDTQKLNRDFVKDDPIFKSTRQPFAPRSQFDMNKRVALAFDAIRHRHLEKQSSSGRLTPILFTQWWLSMVTIDSGIDLQLLSPPKDLVTFMRDMEKRGFIM